jgi:hypothetical protein
MMRDKARRDLSKAHVYRNNQNMVAIVAVQPNIDDTFRSRE